MLKTTIIVASVCISFAGFVAASVAADSQSGAYDENDATQSSDFDQLPPSDDPAEASSEHREDLDAPVSNSGAHFAAPTRTFSKFGSLDQGVSEGPANENAAAPNSQPRKRTIALHGVPSARKAASARFNPNDFVTLGEISPSLLEGAAILNATGAPIGRVSKVMVGRTGAAQAVVMTGADGRSTQIGQASLRFNARNRSLLTNLGAAKLASTRSAN